MEQPALYVGNTADNVLAFETLDWLKLADNISTSSMRWTSQIMCITLNDIKPPSYAMGGHLACFPPSSLATVSFR